MIDKDDVIRKKHGLPDQTGSHIQVHIRRLILDGIDLPHHQQPALKATIEAELSRLLSEGGVSTDLLHGGALAAREVSSIQLANVIRPQELGQQIAHSVYSRLGSSR